MEKIKLGEIKCEQALKECMKVVHSVRDENQSHKQFMVDCSMVGSMNNGKHKFVSDEVKAAAETWATTELNSDSEDDDDEDDEM